MGEAARGREWGRREGRAPRGGAVALPPPAPRGSWNPRPRTCRRGGGSVSPGGSGGGGGGGGGRGGRRGGGYKSVPPRHMHTSGKLPSRSGGHGRSARSRQTRSALGWAAPRQRTAAAGTPAPTCPHGRRRWRARPLLRHPALAWEVVAAAAAGCE